MADIFLSYAREDQPIAKTLAKALTSRGWTVWWDKTIPPGKTFADVIERELHAAKQVLVLWSKASVQSKWVRNEAADADDRGILVPVQVEPDVKIPFAFRLVQAADLIAWDGSILDPRFEAIATVLAEAVPPQARAQPAGLTGPGPASSPSLPKAAPSATPPTESVAPPPLSPPPRKPAPASAPRTQPALDRQPPGLLEGHELKRQRHQTMVRLGRGLAVVAGFLAVVKLFLGHGESDSEEAVMKSDLRKLVTAQEAFFADSVRYASDIRALSYSMSPGVSVSLLSAQSNGWSAVAWSTVAAFKYEVCVIYIGDVPPVAPATKEGKPQCGILDVDSLLAGARGTLVVNADAPATVTVDGRDSRRLVAGDSWIDTVPFGEHSVEAVGDEGNDRWRQVVSVDHPQPPVSLTTTLKQIKEQRLATSQPRREESRPGSSEARFMHLPYYDDFESPISLRRYRWADLAGCQYRVEQGGLAIRALADSLTCQWILNGAPEQGELPARPQIEVTVRLRSGSMKGGFGVAFGENTGTRSLYAAMISGNGYTVISQYNGSEWEALADWQLSPEVKQGLAVANTLAVEVRGRQIQFFVNGALARTAPAPSEVTGFAGMYISGHRMDVLFDDLRVTELP